MVKDQAMLPNLMFHALAAALEQLTVDICIVPSLMAVMFEGVEIHRDRLVTEFDTSYEKQLLLKCLDDCEGVCVCY